MTGKSQKNPAEGQTGNSGADRTGEKMYEDYLNHEKKKEIEDFLKQLRKDMENKFIILDKDISYLSEYQKYLSSVEGGLLGRRNS